MESALRLNWSWSEGFQVYIYMALKHCLNSRQSDLMFVYFLSGRDKNLFWIEMQQCSIFLHCETVELILSFKVDLLLMVDVQVTSLVLCAVFVSSTRIPNRNRNFRSEFYSFFYLKTIISTDIKVWRYPSQFQAFHSFIV